MQLRTLYFRNLFTEIKGHWVVILILVLICGAGFGLYGYKSAEKQLSLSPEQTEKIAHFEERVASYDAAIKDTQDCIADNNELIENLQNYIDNSIYMKIDPNEIRVSSVQYIVVPEEGVNLANVQNSIISFINNGALVSNLDDEYSELNPSYWREIVSVSNPANHIVITVLHYDADKGAKILDVIREKLELQCDAIRKKQGGFRLEGEEISCYVKGDVAVANTQNTTINNLRSYTSSRSDYEAKFVTQNTAKENYIENNTPEELSFPSPKKNAVKFGFFGLIAGAVLVIGVLALKYIFSDKIRSTEELQATGLSILAKSGGRKGFGKNKEGSPASLYPSAERLVMDLRTLLEKTGCKGIFLQDLCAGTPKTGKPAAADEGKSISKTAEELFESVRECGFDIASGASEGDSPEELRTMTDLGSTVLLLEAGKSTFRQLEKQLNLCQRFGVKILGCVLYE